MEQWHGKVALVTGASAGIGAEIAKELVKHKITVFAGARRLDRLNELAKQLQNEPGKLHPIQMDITKESDIKAAFEHIKKVAGGVDILVNNAGVVSPTTLSDGDTEAWQRVLNTNVLGLCIATREAVRSMTERNTNGHIIHINSVLGHKIPSFVGSTINVYAASKYAVTALAETLRQELHANKKQIKVTSVSPGLVKTEFDVANKVDMLTDLLKKVRALEPIDVAKAVVYVLSTPPHVLVSELTIRPLDEP